MVGLEVNVTMGPGDDFPSPERATEIDAELLYSVYKDVVEFGSAVDIPRSALDPSMSALDNSEAVELAAKRAWTTSLRLVETLRRNGVADA